MNARLSVIAIVLTAFPKVFSQGLYTVIRQNVGSCPRLSENSDIFGNITHFSNQGLLPSLFISSEGTRPLILNILRVHLLCEAIGLYRNTASSASYLVEYQVPRDNTLKLAQVSVDCILDLYNPSMNYSFYPSPNPDSPSRIDLNTAKNSLGTLFTGRSGITSTFSTEPAFKCGRCGPQGGVFADKATRCVCK